ncbi:alpha/beta fold hydrolase [Candidatus Woesearchaeota archaeon]|nr:alpha/beta fold hydrolase [Candidatus Woesearchaeota archaeon]
MDVTFKNNKGEKLAGILEGSGSKGVILCHGFTGNKDEPLLKSLAKSLVQAGFLVLRFDFSGNGKSEGKFEESHHEKEFGDLLCAIAFLKEKGCDSIGLVGHSMGGEVALLAGREVKLSGMATLSTPVHLSAELLLKFAMDWAGKKLSDEFLEVVARTDLIKAVKNIKAPLLVIHGKNDTIVEVEEADELYGNANEPKKKVIVDSNHNLLKDRAKVIEEVVLWMRKYI